MKKTTNAAATPGNDLELLDLLRQDLFLYCDGLDAHERFSMNHILGHVERLLQNPKDWQSACLINENAGTNLLQKMFGITTYTRYKVSGDMINVKHNIAMLGLLEKISTTAAEVCNR